MLHLFQVASKWCLLSLFSFHARSSRLSNHMRRAFPFACHGSKATVFLPLIENFAAPFSSQPESVAHLRSFQAGPLFFFHFPLMIRSSRLSGEERSTKKCFFFSDSSGAEDELFEDEGPPCRFSRSFRSPRCPAEPTSPLFPHSAIRPPFFPAGSLEK